MELFLPIAAFGLALLGTLRSPGLGLTTVLVVGYLNGVVRANFLGVYSTFMFDAGLLGLYVGFLGFHTVQLSAAMRSTLGLFVLALVAWPAVVTTVPVNDYLVQLVALRGTVWFLPVALIATRFNTADLTVVARGLAILNVLSLAVGIYEFQYGVESVFPKNAVTELMYRASDVAGNTLRIPSTFMNAHSYGGAMLLSLPFVLDRLFGRDVGILDRTIAACGIIAAVGGMLLCATRTPLVIAAVAVSLATVCSRLNLWFVMVTVGLLTLGVLASTTSERLQRAATLEDTEMVAARVGGSVNENFLDVLAEYPFGAGMGSSVGTSVPFFLADRAPPQVGMENEFSRITVDQGWIGLGLWLVFLGWLLARPPHARFVVSWQIGRVLMYAVVFGCWGTAFIGTGTLAAVPGSVLLLAQMGVLAAERTPSPQPVR